MGAVIADPSRVLAIERPSRRLLAYWALASLLAGPAFPILLAFRWVRYRTLRYRFDGEGISMSWGVLFHREIHLTYSRIQDIHLTSNVVERYLGLARILIQTASGKAGAEMTIAGLEEHEAVRDFVYSRMRGQRVDAGVGPAPAPPGTTPADERLVAALEELAASLRELSRLLGETTGRLGARGE